MMRTTGPRGFALLIVLWSVALLALLGTGITAAGRTEVQLAGNLRAAARAEAAADGAVELAAFHLLDPVSPWAADGRARTVDVPGARVTLTIEDEAGRVNPNTASPELLLALLRQVGAAAEPAAALARAIVQWRFPRTQAGLSFGTPAAPPDIPPEYRGLGYGPPGAPFESLDELGLVVGMTPDLLAALTPHLSLYTDTDPDPALAGPVVRQALQAAFGPAALRAGPGSPPRLIRLTVSAATPEGGRFVRRATIRVGRSERERLLTVLTWSD